MSDVVERAQALRANITPGLWEARPADITRSSSHWGVYVDTYRTVAHAAVSYDGFGNGSRQADAEFIAAAPQLIDDLLDEVQQLRAYRRESRIERAIAKCGSEDDPKTVAAWRIDRDLWRERALRAEGAVARVRALAEEKLAKHGQCWNSIFGREILVAIALRKGEWGES